MSESKLETAEETAEKWHESLSLVNKARYEATGEIGDRVTRAYWENNKENLCEAFAAGFVAAIDRQP